MTVCSCHVTYAFQSVRIAKNQYDHLKYLKLSDSSDSKFNCNVDILVGADYYWKFLFGNIRRGNSGPVAAETILDRVLSGTYELENDISATVNLSSTHVLKISVQESDINYDSCFQKFWQIESSETKAKSFSDYSKHVYFNGHKYETPLPWKKHCELILGNYALCESHLYSLIKRLKRDSVTLQAKSKNLKELLRNPQKNLNPPELCIIFHTILLLELKNQLLVCVLFMMHLLKRMVPL